MSDRDRFDKFTERARRVLHLAQEEAQEFHHNYIGVEHLLLGLVREGEGVAGKALLSLGVDLQKLRTAVVEVSGSGKEGVSNQIGLTPQGKKAIEMAVDEAHRLNHHYIGTEHLLLALIRQHDTTITAIFGKLGVKLEDVSNQAASILSSERSTSMSQQSASRLQGERNRFERFSSSARIVLSLAQEEAQRFQHTYIGSEHLLLGLMRQQEGLAYQILNSLGLTLNQARETLEFITGRGDRIVLGEIGMTPRAKGIIEQATEEATLLGSPTVETEHLLLAIVREREGIAIGILESLGREKAQVYTRTLVMLSQEIAARDAAPAQRSKEPKTPRVSGNESPAPSADEEANS